MTFRPSRRRPRAFVAAAVAALACLSIPAVAQERFGDQTAVTVVEVPVRVVGRDGEPVRGLTRDSFRLFDGDREVTIDSFEVVDLAATPDGAAPAAGAAVQPGARRSFLLLFDLSFSTPAQTVAAWTSARQMVADGAFHPSDRVGVAFHTSRQGLAVPLGLTTDRHALARVLDGFGLLLGQTVDVERFLADGPGAHGADPLSLSGGSGRRVLSQVGASVGMEPSAVQTALGLIAPGTRGSLDVGAENVAAHLEEFMAEWDILQRQQLRQKRASEVRTMVANYQALADALAQVDGQKHLVVFTGGFPARLMEIDNDTSVDGPTQSQTLTALADMVDVFRRSGWVIHTVEPRSAGTPFGGESPAASLTYLARETGGRTFHNWGDVSAALGELLEETGASYLLTFRAQGLAADGAFHPLRVELEDVPRGTRALHRGGYMAPRPAGEGADSALSRRATTAALLLSDEVWESLPVAIWAGAAAISADGGAVSVPLVVEVAGEGLLVQRPDGSAPAGAKSVEIYAYAFAPDGGVAGFVARTVELDLARHRDTLEAGGLKLLGELVLEPGTYQLRTLVRTPDNGLSTLGTTLLDLAGAPDGELAGLLPPVFLQGTEESWVVAWGRDEGDQAAAGSPFVLDGREFLPAARPELDVDETAQLIVPVMDLDAGGSSLESRVTDASGRAVAGGELAVVSRSVAEAGTAEPDRLVTTFRPVGLAPGDYRLVLTLVDRASGRREIVSAPFRIAG